MSVDVIISDCVFGVYHNRVFKKVLGIFKYYLIFHRDREVVSSKTCVCVARGNY